MPSSAAIVAILSVSREPMKTGSVDTSLPSSPISSKKRSCEPPGAWLTSLLPTPPPTPPPPPRPPPQRRARATPRASGLRASCRRPRRRSCGRGGCPWGRRRAPLPRPQDTAFDQELVLPFEHVEGLVLAVLDVG